MAGQRVAELTGQTNFIHTDHLGSTRTVTDYTGSPIDKLDYLPYGEQIAGGASSTHKFTGYERDAETGLDNASARYYAAPLGMFMSPDPMGGHFMNPQSLNRYAYVHNNPLSMIDPNGLDCVYANQVDEHGVVSIAVESGDCSQDNGTYVSGTVNLNSFNLTQSASGYSLSFGYTSYGTGDFSLFSTSLPGLSSGSLMNGFGLGQPVGALNSAATQIFSQVYRNTHAVTNPAAIASFYGVSALAGMGVAGPEIADLWVATSTDIAALTAKLGTASLGVFEAVRFIVQNPEYWNQASDFVNSLVGKDFGPVPATWGGIWGSELSMAKDLFDYDLELVTEGVPH